MTDVADTAYAIALARADERELFSDPWARRFVPPTPAIREACERFLGLPFFRDGIRLRTRFLDDAVVGARPSQVVIVGAGFDCRALRLPELAGARVFELDLPQQIERKRALLGADARSVFVPFDFEKDGADTLAAHGFHVGAGAAFIWEGVIGYIDDAMIARTLRFMAEAGGAGSTLAYTSGAGRFAPDTPAERFAPFGWREVEEIGLDVVWRRYLDGEPPPGAELSTVGTARS